MSENKRNDIKPAQSSPGATEAQIIEELEKEGKALLQSIFDSSLVQMSVLKAVRDNEGAILDFQIFLINRELQKETGRSDLVGKMYAREYPGIRKAGLFDIMINVVQTGEPAKVEYFYDYDGFNRWFLSTFVKMDDGLVATNLDISVRKEAEQKALKNLVLLEQTEALAKSGSWDYNVATKEFCWSDGMYRLFEIPKGTAVKPDIYLEYVTNDDLPLATRLVRSITETFEAFEEIIRLRVNDAIKIVKLKSVTIYDASGVVTKVLGIDIDLTAVFHAEEVTARLNQRLLESAELVSRKEEFINIASHELKTPVTSIKAYAEVLQQQFEEAGDMESASSLRKLNTQVDRLTHMIKNLLDATSLSDGEMHLQKEIFDMNLLIGERIAELQPLSRSHQLILKSAQPVNLSADKARIGQVLTNLIINAIKYSPGGGQIVMDARSKGQWVEVSVRDEGIGIKKILLDKIFQRFYRVEETVGQGMPGLGLGLDISSDIVNRHGGKITVVSEEGKGSTFTFSLPSSGAAT